MTANIRPSSAAAVVRTAGARGSAGESAFSSCSHKTEEMRELVLERASDARLLESARRGGMTTLREECLALVRAGETTLEEVLRVTQERG